MSICSTLVWGPDWRLSVSSYSSAVCHFPLKGDRPTELGMALANSTGKAGRSSRRKRTNHDSWRERDMRKQKGFSLIELLIVVAIILIIAAIAIPNLLRSRIAANEASAVGSIRTINTSEVTYASTYPQVGFALLPPLGGAGGSSAGAGW